MSYSVGDEVFAIGTCHSQPIIHKAVITKIGDSFLWARLFVRPWKFHLRNGEYVINGKTWNLKITERGGFIGDAYEPTTNRKSPLE